jgi:hypothetical protein
MHEASEGEFYAALCAFAVVALALVFVAVGVIPSFGLFPNGPGQRVGNVQGQTQGSRTTVAVFRHVSSPPPVPSRL